MIAQNTAVTALFSIITAIPSSIRRNEMVINLEIIKFRDKSKNQSCICEILTGGVRVWNAHRPDRKRYSMPVGGCCGILKNTK